MKTIGSPTASLTLTMVVALITLATGAQVNGRLKAYLERCQPEIPNTAAQITKAELKHKATAMNVERCSDGKKEPSSSSWPLDGNSGPTRSPRSNPKGKRIAIWG